MLEELVNLGRLSPSAANLQPLKYILCVDPKVNAAIFPCLGWAGYLKTWDGPEDGERPAAYIVVLGDTGISKNFDCDLGIACQSIMLGAREIGLAGCMIGSIKRGKLKETLNIDDRFKLLLVLAIGKPKEEIVLEAAGPTDSIEYWRDDKGIHHVPKRNLADIISASYDCK
jgi:nitroreductase